MVDVRSNRRCAAADVLALDGLSWCRLGVDAAGAGLGDAVDAHSVAAMPPLGTVSMKSGASLTLWANANYAAISNFFLALRCLAALAPSAVARSLGRLVGLDWPISGLAVNVGPTGLSSLL